MTVALPHAGQEGRRRGGREDGRVEEMDIEQDTAWPSKVLRGVYHCQRERRVKGGAFLEMVVGEGVARAQTEEEGAELGTSEGNRRSRRGVNMGKTALVLAELVHWTPTNRRKKEIKIKRVVIRR